MKKIKYIGGDPKNGIVIDWQMIKRELKKLIKDHVGDKYVPDPPFDVCNWFVDNSERSVGKTTQYLLIGMLLDKYYGITTEYLRVKREQIRPQNLRDLFTTIEMPEFQYVEKLTDGKYNAIMYNSKRFYYCNIDGSGKVDKETVSETAFCHVECLDNVDNVKSLYNNPRASYVILDEFVNASGINKEADFLNLCQILSTYRRDRLDMKVVLLANTINPLNMFYQELCISDDMRKLHLGESKIVESPLGTKVWIHLVKFDEKITEKRRVNSLKYFGFLNPRLASINGGTEWAIKNYPHLPRLDIYENEQRQILFRDVYIRTYGKLLCCEICFSTKIGRYMYVREQTQTPINPLRIYSTETCMNLLEKYGLGDGDKLDKLIFWLYENKRVFYSYNNIGNLFENYIETLR